MDARQYRRYIEEHRRLGKPEDCPVTVYGIMLHCWAHELVLIEQGLTSHQTHYRSYRGRFLQVIWPYQQCQSTEENQLVFHIRLESHQDHSTMLQ